MDSKAIVAAPGQWRTRLDRGPWPEGFPCHGFVANSIDRASDEGQRLRHRVAARPRRIVRIAAASQEVSMRSSVASPVVP
jgi:hypothetical protein